MKKNFVKTIVSILFVGMFFVPVVGSSVSVHGSTVAPMGGEPGPFMD
ncbi:hypothetical protein [Clostridium manihotivorum]|nr:hypothetical protein [Clostridium manihotivorum]